MGIDESLRLGHRLESPHPPLSQEIFDIPMAQVQVIVEPDSIGNDLRSGSVSLVGIFADSINFGYSTWRYSEKSTFRPFSLPASEPVVLVCFTDTTF